MQYPAPGSIHPSTNGPAKLWVLQGFNSPTTPGGALNGITRDFANIQIPKTPKTPKTPKGVAVPSRDSNFTEVGFPNWTSIFDGVLRKVQDEEHYGNCLGLDGSEELNGSGAAGTLEASALLTAQSVHDLLQSVVGAHLPAWKAFLNTSLRAVPSALPSSPNPLSIAGPIPPLSQQLLLQSLSAYLSGVLLPHQLSLVVSQLHGQNHYILGQILRGAGFPVDTHMLGAGSGGSCGLRQHASVLQARLAVMRTFIAAQRAKHQQRMQQQQQQQGQPQQSTPAPIFYLSPSFAHSLGFPECLPRLCSELGVTAASFKVLPLCPTMDEEVLQALPREQNQLDARDEACPLLASPGGHALLTASATSPNPPSSPSGESLPNPFLTYQLDTQSLESEVNADLQAMGSSAGGAVLAPCAVFATTGNVAGLDLPYEFDNLRELARVAVRFGLFVHAEGTSLFPGQADDKAPGGASLAGAAGAAEQTKSRSSSSSSSSAAELQPVSTLFESVDSILLHPGSWLGLMHGPALLAFRNPALLPTGSSARRSAEQNGLWTALPQHASNIAPGGGAVPSAEEFAAAFALWFNLIQIHSGSFSSLLARLHAKQNDKVATVRRLVASQSFPVFVAPAGENDEQRAAYVSRFANSGATTSSSVPWFPTAPSHPHLFFALSVPSPWAPSDFHMDRSALNSWVSSRLAARLSAKQGDYIAHSKVFGLALLPVQHFDRVGLMYRPSPLSIWTSDAAVEEEIAGVARLLSEVVAQEVTLLETQARLRAEFEELLCAEAPEFLYVHPRDIVRQPDVYVGLGGVRFVPSQIPEQHLEEVGALLNDALAQTQAALHVTPSSTANAAAFQAQQQASAAAGSAAGGAHNTSSGGSVPGESYQQYPPSLSAGTSGSQMVSMYRAGRTLGGVGGAGSVCTVLEVSELVVRKSLRNLLGEMKAAAARLRYPKHITDDMAETLRQGIRAAEEKLQSKSADAYRPSSVLRWVPLVGSVLNWVAPPAAGAAHEGSGQSFDMKRKELSSIKYSYSAGPPSTQLSVAAASAASSASSSSGSSAANTPGGRRPSSSSSASSASSSSSSLGLNTAHSNAGSNSNLHGLSTPQASGTPLSINQSPQHGHFTSPPLTGSGSAQASSVTTVGASANSTPTSSSSTSSSPQQHPHALDSQQGSRKHSGLQLNSSLPGQQQGRPPLPPSGGSFGAPPPFSQLPVHVGQPVQPQQLQQAPAGGSPPQHSTSPPQQQQGTNAQTTPPQQSTPPQSSMSASTSSSHTAATATVPAPVLPPVKITLDEAEQSFVALLNSAPRSLQAEQLALLTRGEVFLAYFPNEVAEGDAASSAARAAPPSTSVTKLRLFLEPAYHPSAEEAAELGVAGGTPGGVSLLCWCEPGTRYVKTDQAVLIEQITEMHLGVTALFPRQAVRANCFSLVTQHVQLHLEADGAAKRKDWFLALYTLVSQAPAAAALPTANGFGAVQQTNQHGQQLQQQLMPPSVAQGSGPFGGHMSAAEEEAALVRSRALLEGGMPFVVYVLDKHDSELTSRHEVVLWYRPPGVGANGAGVPHSLCWCRRGSTLDFSPARSLPLNKTVQICMGKQTKAFKNAAAQHSDPAAAFSVMVEKMILNLEANSADDRASWLSAFHTVMSASGKKRVFDQEQQQQQQQQQQSQQQRQV